MIELPDETGQAYTRVVAWWLTRVETNGNGKLVEIPERRLTEEECRRLEAAIVARQAPPPKPVPDEHAAMIPNLPGRIVALIERDGATTRPAIEAETGCTPAQAHRALRGLRDAGRVRLEGHGAGARYMAAEPRDP